MGKHDPTDLGIFIVILIIVVGALLFTFTYDMERQEKPEPEPVVQEINFNIEIYIETDEDMQQLKELMLEWLEEWNVDVFKTTNYAPLDPNAVEGMCFSGDPTVTASGAKVKIGKTAAGGPALPFGTRIFVEGFGWRTITDRGGAIGNKNVDVAVWSKADAYGFGRQDRTVIYQGGEV